MTPSEERKLARDLANGRVSYSLHVTNSGMYGGYLDISVMPVVRLRRSAKRG